MKLTCEIQGRCMRDAGRCRRDVGEMWARYRHERREADLARAAAALPGDDELRLRHAARDQPLLAGEGAVAGELVLDGLGLVELEVCRQAGVGLLGRVGVGAAMALTVQVGVVLVGLGVRVGVRVGVGVGVEVGLGVGVGVG